MKKVGIIIFLLGFILTVSATITYFSKEKAVTLEKVEITEKEQSNPYYSPVTGIAIMGIGAIIFWQTFNER
jgi:uncharacterized membrane protein